MITVSDVWSSFFADILETTVWMLAYYHSG
jgi:hypothetical protein